MSGGCKGDNEAAALFFCEEDKQIDNVNGGKYKWTDPKKIHQHVTRGTIDFSRQGMDRGNAIKSSDYHQYGAYEGKNDNDNKAIIKTIPTLFYTTISEPVGYQSDRDQTHYDRKHRAMSIKHCNKIDKAIQAA